VRYTTYQNTILATSANEEKLVEKTLLKHKLSKITLIYLEIGHHTGRLISMQTIPLHKLGAAYLINKISSFQANLLT